MSPGAERAAPDRPLAQSDPSPEGRRPHDTTSVKTDDETRAWRRALGSNFIRVEPGRPDTVVVRGIPNARHPIDLSCADLAALDLLDATDPRFVEQLIGELRTLLESERCPR